MRILVYTTAFSGMGGIETHLLNFCEAMSPRITIDLVIPGSRMSIEQANRLAQCCNKISLLSLNIRFLKPAWLFAILATKRPVRYDALYTNGQGKSVSLVAKLVRYRKWIHHHHTSGDLVDSLTWPPEYSEAMRRADHVIACSETNARCMESLLGRRVDPMTIFTKQVTARHQPTNGAPLRFGYFGRLIPEKGIDLIARLSEDPLLTDIEWHVWGEGAQYQDSFFTNHPRIHKHGAFKDRNGLRDALSSLDAYVLLSTNPEGLPLALLECMGAGVPWIATDRGGIRDILCDPSATMMLPSDFAYEQAREAVRTLFRKIMTGECRSEILVDYYKTYLSAEVISERWMKLMAP